MLSARRAFCSTITIVTPARLTSSTFSKIASTKAGARPAEGSSSSSTCGSGISAEGGTTYTFEELPQAIEALQNGEDINYEGASGPIEQDDAGDATAGVYDIYEFNEQGEPTPISEVPVAGQ